MPKLIGVFLAILFGSAATSAVNDDFLKGKGAEPSASLWGKSAFPKTKIYKGAAVVGVDGLGRILIALDNSHNGFIDNYFLITADHRIEGPWSHVVHNAKITLKRKSELESTFVVRDRHGGVGISVSINGSVIKLNERQYSRVLSIENVREIATKTINSWETGPQLSSADHFDIRTWPESFWTDALDPGTVSACNLLVIDSTCTQGGGTGNGSGFCKIDQELNPAHVIDQSAPLTLPCPVGSDCQALCPAFQEYACCACVSGGTDCRCKMCPPCPPGRICSTSGEEGGE